VVWTDSGPVRGTVATDHRTFQGIPFAAPPVGELRWQPPQPPDPWFEPRDATRPGPRCAQPATFTPASDTEDCLYLNVTTPRPSARLKPVMVWLHGGGNAFGSGIDYDAHRLAAGGDVVVVTVNYRLGVFGFLGHPDLPDSGDFGLEDQQAALRWVQRNAVAFGGNPANVTLFGQSGGAYDTCAQLTSPSARGLFQRAIFESGTCSISWPANGVNPGISAGKPWQPLADSQAAGKALAVKEGCADPATQVDCLRRIPVAQLLTDTGGPELPKLAFGNRVLPESPDQALAAGHFQHLPVMSGTTRDEQRLATAFLQQAFTEDGYQQLLVQAFGDKAPQVAALYKSGDLGSPALAWAAVATDRTWSCSQLIDDELLGARTFAFEFADRNAPPPQLPFPLPPGYSFGAYHSAEMQYLFDVGGSPAAFTPDQQKLADQLIRYWTRFAATGNPNGDDSPAWPRFRPADVQSLAPGEGGIKPVGLSVEHHCEFWAGLR
jgi:para-nitrobenzyl esterase